VTSFHLLSIITNSSIFHRIPQTANEYLKNHEMSFSHNKYPEEIFQLPILVHNFSPQIIVLCSLYNNI